MENKINIAELLTDCPRGMELDCVLCENVTFECIVDGNCFPIQIQTPEGNMQLSQHGCMSLSRHAKCIIFPKGKTTWDGFVPPCQFKDGDVIFTHTNALKCNLDNNWVSIFKEYRNNRCACYVCLCLSDLELYHDKWEDELLCELCEIEESRLATEEEKQKLFDAIRANGYKWNEETKTLEKLIEPRFKVGNVIQDEDGYKVKITEVNIEDECYGYESLIAKGIGGIAFREQDDWELVPDKFDISTLIPFESRVLVRDSIYDEWKVSFWGCMSDCDRDYKYDTVRGYYKCCIPYESNEHLLGKADDCDEYYKTWE